jgi:hypothetical protein
MQDRTDQGVQPDRPECVADPKYENYTTQQRSDIARDIHMDRCIRTLKFMKPAVAATVARHFIAIGWISEEDVPSTTYHHHDEPATPFRRADDTLSDIESMNDQ